ncbi:MAG: hypothetical protein IJN88_04265 [Clostridia bacterium]|nr:hypothetical protein [Clostridia bacterium]
MKLKESKEISFYGKLPLIFFLCCAVTVIIRTVQVFSFIDRETGFYTGGSVLKVALYGVIALSGVFFAVTTFLSKETAEVALQFKKDGLLSALACILSLSFIYDSLASFMGAFDSLGSSTYGVSAFQSMMLSGTIPQFLQSIFAVFSAVYFLSFAKGTIKGTDSASKHKILAVAPVGWAGFRLVYRFVEQISYVRVSELLLELILLALLVMLFMAFAQVNSGVYLKNARWRIIGLGLPAAMISLTLNVPRLVFVLTKGADYLYSDYPFRVSDFVLALFFAVLAAKLVNRNKKSANA